MSIPRLAHSPTSAWNAFNVYLCFNNTILPLCKQERLKCFNPKTCITCNPSEKKTVKCGYFHNDKGRTAATHKRFGTSPFLLEL